MSPSLQSDDRSFPELRSWSYRFFHVGLTLKNYCLLLRVEDKLRWLQNRVVSLIRE